MEEENGTRNLYIRMVLNDKIRVETRFDVCIVVLEWQVSDLSRIVRIISFAIKYENAITSVVETKKGQAFVAWRQLSWLEGFGGKG